MSVYTIVVLKPVANDTSCLEIGEIIGNYRLFTNIPWLYGTTDCLQTTMTQNITNELIFLGHHRTNTNKQE